MARGEVREQAILAATLRLLEQSGYAAMTIDGIAAAARASKATIYRRWSSKAELVKAALDTLDAEHVATIPDTGTLRGDLVAVMNALREKASEPYVGMMSELASAARHDDELAALLRQHTQSEELSPFQPVLRRAIRRGVLSRSTNTELMHDVAEALILRQLQLGLAFDTSFIARVVDLVLLPLLQPKRRRP